MKNQLIALLLALVLLLILGLKNMDPVTLDFFVGSVEMPLVYLLAAFVLVGMIMVWAVALVGRFRSGLQRSRLRKEIEQKDREIEGLKTELAKHESLAGDAAVREAEAFNESQLESKEEKRPVMDGRCHAVTVAGRRCPNAALAGEMYCGIPAHRDMSVAEGGLG